MAASCILVVGATGQQGSATIDYLLTTDAQAPAPKILALTRLTTSPRALKLVAKHGDKITLVEGSPNLPEPIFTARPDITSVFLVTVPHTEEDQAFPIIDAAVAHGVRHIVFSSVDRGGDERSWGYETPVGHFAAKCHIEEYLRTACEKQQQPKDGRALTRWTILRPTGFMDNYAPGTSFALMMWTLWATIPRDKKMQLISTQDIGVCAAKVLLEGADTWAGRAVGLAGDELSFEEAEATFRKVMGHEPPRMWSYVGSGIRWAVGEASQSMKWFEEVGFGVDIDELRRVEPRVQTFETWLEANYKKTASEA